jgi:hypothetical protein
MRTPVTVMSASVRTKMITPPKMKPVRIALEIAYLLKVEIAIVLMYAVGLSLT